MDREEILRKIEAIRESVKSQISQLFNVGAEELKS